MNHPELLLFPVMMLLDYFLTVWGAILSERKYKQHFKFEHYEINPIWQKTIARKQWFNPKHLASVAFVSVMCILWSNGWTGRDYVMEGMFGFITIFIAGIIGVHVSNILTFNYLLRHPEFVSGEVTMSHLLTFSMSRFRLCTLFFPLVLISIFSPTPFVIGGLCSQIVHFIVNLVWTAKAKRKVRKENPV
jgi:uncharacterized membrane protein YciS (DUF1049 family)